MSIDTPALTITPFDPADRAMVDAAFDIAAAAIRVDVPDFPRPCRHRWEASLRTPWPDERLVRRLAYLDGRPVGRADIEFYTTDNLDNASVNVTVHPDARRRGVGRALYRDAVELVRADGRKRIMADCGSSRLDGRELAFPGVAFATAMGLKPALEEVRRRLDVTTVDHAELDRLLAEAWQKAAGYSAVTWGNSAPEEYVDGIAALDSQFVDEAPMGDLEWEPEKVDAARVRRVENVKIEYGTRSYNTGIVHDASGAIVAWSQLTRAKTVPEHAFQQITLVHPGHRGHRLGIISKIVNLRYLLEHEPAVAAIDTWNADVNKHMIAINEAMGFRPVDTWTNWQTEI